MESKDTVSSCSVSKETEIQQTQKKARLLKVSSMSGLKALQSNFKYLSDVLKDFGGVATFKRTFSQDMDLLKNHLTKKILHEIDCKTTMTALRTMLEKIFNSKLIKSLNFNFKKYTRFETQSFKDTMIGDMDFIKKYMLETILYGQETQRLLNERKLQMQECKDTMVQALDANLAVMEAI
ncbi:hypothetical protein Tco_0452374 [Tanacetum coccineum]